MNRFSVKTFGCKANLSDSQQIEAELIELGMQPTHDSPELLVFNSCAVTDQAEKELKYAIRKAKRENPEAQILVTGCSAEINPSRWEKMDEVKWTIGNQDKAQFAAVLQKRSLAEKRLGAVSDYDQFLSRHPMDREWPVEANAFSRNSLSKIQISKRHRAFIKIQEGCNSFCTFCIIPYGRGPSRSLPENEVIEQINGLHSEGFREIVFTGTNIGEYGTDLDTTQNKGDGFTKLLKSVLKNTSIERMRLSSLDPLEITDELLELVSQETRICPHFHVSLQSPHSEILRKMKRHYSSADSERTLKKIQKVKETRQSVFVGMDVITGFPGETQEIFAESQALLSDWPWTRLHVFPYSERKGTPATRLPGSVPWAERLERAKILNELSQKRLNGFYVTEQQKLLSGETVLNDLIGEGTLRVSTDAKPLYLAHTANYLRVVSSSDFRKQRLPLKPQNIEIIEEKHSNDFVLKII